MGPAEMVNRDDLTNLALAAQQAVRTALPGRVVGKPVVAAEVTTAHGDTVVRIEVRVKPAGPG